MPGTLAVRDARSIQVDGDLLPQPVSLQHEQVAQVAPQSIVIDRSVELAQEADQVNVGDGLSYVGQSDLRFGY